MTQTQTKTNMTFHTTGLFGSSAGTSGYPEQNDKNASKLEQARFLRVAGKIIAEHGFTIRFKFNPGGIAIWGETFFTVYDASGAVVVEGQLSRQFSYIRQAREQVIRPGQTTRNSGVNNQLRGGMAQFISLVYELARAEFRRF